MLGLNYSAALRPCVHLLRVYFTGSLAGKRAREARALVFSSGLALAQYAEPALDYEGIFGEAEQGVRQIRLPAYVPPQVVEAVCSRNRRQPSRDRSDAGSLAFRRAKDASAKRARDYSRRQGTGRYARGRNGKLVYDHLSESEALEQGRRLRIAKDFQGRLGGFLRMSAGDMIADQSWSCHAPHPRDHPDADCFDESACAI